MVKPESTFTIKGDLYDRLVCKRICTKEDNFLSKYLTTLPEITQDLGQDLFTANYKYVPELKKPEQVAQSHISNHEVMSEFVGDLDFKKVHRDNMGDEVASATYAFSYLSEYVKKYKQQLEELQKLQKERQKLQRQIDDLQDNIVDKNNELQQRRKSGRSAQSIKNAIQRLQEALKQKQSACSQLDESCKMNTPKITRTDHAEFMKVAKETSDSMHTISRFMNPMQEQPGNSYGSEAGQLSLTEVGDKLKLAERIMNNPKFREMAKSLGKFTQILTGMWKSKVKHETGEITKVIQSNDLTNLLPSEYLGLVDEDLEILFLKNYAESSLFSYETKLRDTSGRGPIICSIDMSGSMCGEKEIWSKSVCLALISIAHKQKRDLHIIMFDSGIDAEIAFPKKMSNVEYQRAFLDVASTFSGGGTDFTAPIKKSMELINKDHRFKKADMFIITDGCGSLSQNTENDLMELKKRITLKTMMVVIGNDENRLKGVMDKCINLNQLTDKITTTIFEEFV